MEGCIMALVNKNTIGIRESIELELTAAQAAQVKAILEYNIMMGNMDDPAEEENEDE